MTRTRVVRREAVAPPLYFVTDPSTTKARPTTTIAARPTNRAGGHQKDFRPSYPRCRVRKSANARGVNACRLRRSHQGYQFWDSNNYLAETDDQNEIQAVYTNEPQSYGNLISQYRKDGAIWTPGYHHYDALGSTRALTDDGGDVSDTYIYDAWGNEVAVSGSTINPFRWVGGVGYYYDESSGTFYVRARVYEPVTGRWMSMDPLYYPFADPLRRAAFAVRGPLRYADRSSSLYEYASSSPLMLLDAQGRQANAAPESAGQPTKPPPLELPPLEVPPVEGIPEEGPPNMFLTCDWLLGHWTPGIPVSTPGCYRARISLTKCVKIGPAIFKYPRTPGGCDGVTDEMVVGSFNFIMNRFWKERPPHCFASQSCAEDETCHYYVNRSMPKGLVLLLPVPTNSGLFPKCVAFVPVGCKMDISVAIGRCCKKKEGTEEMPGIPSPPNYPGIPSPPNYQR